jgi:hypothetical protein
MRENIIVNKILLIDFDLKWLKNDPSDEFIGEVIIKLNVV